MKGYSFFVLITAVIMTACSKKSIPSAAAGNRANAVAESVSTPAAPAETVASSKTADFTAAGKNIYLSKCGRCHALKSTTDYTRQQWIPIMDRMAVKAKLSDVEKTEVLVYVQANARK